MYHVPLNFPTPAKILFRASPDKRDFFSSIDNYVDADWPIHLT